MAASAKLNTGLKNTKLSPPINGIQPGQLNSKEESRTYRPLFHAANRYILPL